jgi:hypothetical protein
VPEQADLDRTDQDRGQDSHDDAKRLGDRLQDRVYLTVFPNLAQGFLEDRKQRLGVDQEPSDDELADVSEATLTLLYRLLFLLYAESRDLLPAREPAYYAGSLKKMREEIAATAGTAARGVDKRIRETYSDAETVLYDRLLRLFQSLDEGDPLLNAPAYNGGLFNTSSQAHGQPSVGLSRADQISHFLREHKVPDRQLALAIDCLSRDQDQRTRTLSLIDYKSFEVRRLGAIYEGLLELKLCVADADRTKRNAVVRKGQVYLANDNARRKATGSYYTPDSIVEYVVANTVGPVVETKLEALRRDFRKAAKTFDNELHKSQVHPSAEVRQGRMDHRQWAAQQTYNEHKALVERLFDLKVLDPAMGSGHFLVEAVDFITERLSDFLSKFPTNPVNFALERTRQSILEALVKQGMSVDPARLTDIHLLKRHVLKQCIYGVDINPMAVELAKASLWLDAFTPGSPLNFLDHHLRCGNALVGATFEDLRQTLWGDLRRVSFEPLQRALRRVFSIGRRADATSAEIRQSAEEHAQARMDLSAYQTLLDLLVAEHFGLPETPELLKRGKQWDLSSREKFLESVPDGTDRLTAEQARQLGQRPDLRFFHWELEFPDVYYTFADPGQRQMRPKNDWIPGSAGFDCVVGNPPYVRIQTLDKTLVQYLAKKFKSAVGKFDLYVPFLERGTALLRQNGLLGMIVPNKFMTAKYGAAFRGFVTRDRLLRQIVDYEFAPVFPGVSTYCCLLFLGCQPSETVVVARGELERPVARDPIALPSDRLDAAPWSLRAPASPTPVGGTPLKVACQAIFQGLITGADRLLIGLRDAETVRFGDDCVDFEPGIFRPLLKGPDVRRFALRFANHYVLYPYQLVDGRTELMTEEEIATHFPGAYQYLRRHRRELEDRGSNSMVYPAWYAHWCPRTIERFASPKIVTQVLAARASFALDLQGTFTFVGGGNAGVYGIVPHAADENQLWLLLGILNSGIFDAQVQARSSRFRGGYFSYARRFIEDAVIPQLDGLDLSSSPAQHLVALVKQRVEEMSATSALLDAEIDATVSELYRSSDEGEASLSGGGRAY